MLQRFARGTFLGPTLCQHFPMVSEVGQANGQIYLTIRLADHQGFRKAGIAVDIQHHGWRGSSPTMC